MLSFRRYATYFGLAACLVFMLNYFRSPIISTAPELHETFQGKLDPESFRDPETHRLRWDLVPARYHADSTWPLPKTSPKTLPRVQYDFAPETSSHFAKRKDRQQAVKSTFERCWKAYKEHAWMKDEVAPLSGGHNDGFGGWAATLVDSLDTLWIMGLKSEFETAVTAAVNIDLSWSTTQQINVFETTIRHLGGFLSAYDLSGDTRLLKKAKEFGDMLILAFDTPNQMPITRWVPWDLFKGPQVADTNVLVAEIGSLSMEFTRLSLLTGDPKWLDVVWKIAYQLEKQQYKTFLPGMWPVTINAREMDFAGDSLFTLSAMSDSLYEYFPKMHALVADGSYIWEKLYEGSMTSAVRYNLFRPMTPDNADILVSGEVRKMSATSQAQLDPQGQHLVCFAGGMFALGSKLFRMKSHLDIAKKLTDGCIWTYKNMPLGIMPEKFRMVPCESKFECPWNETRWMESVAEENPDRNAEEAIEKRRLPKGFTELADRRYILRPEAIESMFYLYRITGEEHLLDTAWDMFTAITNATETPLANAALNDVSYTQADLETHQIQADSMESFWMAETLKYFYLMFSEPSAISLDEWVFNTEAHPFKRRLPEE